MSCTIARKLWFSGSYLVAATMGSIWVELTIHTWEMCMFSTYSWCIALLWWYGRSYSTATAEYRRVTWTKLINIYGRSYLCYVGGVKYKRYVSIVYEAPSGQINKLQHTSNLHCKACPRSNHSSMILWIEVRLLLHVILVQTLTGLWLANS